MKDKMKRIVKNEKIVVNAISIVGIFVVLYALISFGIISKYNSTILTMVLVSVILATSLNVATGFLGQLALGHAGFMAIGAYTAAIIGIAIKDASWVTSLGEIGNLLVFFLGAIGAFIAAGIAGVLVGTPALRLRGDYLGIMTLGFGEIIRAIITNLDFTGGAQGLTKIPRIMSFPLAYFVTVFVVVLIYLFMNSRHGRAILSIREDEIASESVGTNLTRYKILGFVISSAFGGVGGAVYAFQVGYLAPAAFTFIKSIDILVIVVLGGMGSLSGGIIAAIFLTFLPEYLRDFNQYRLLMYSVLLVITMLYRPQGLLGTKEVDFHDVYLKIKNRFNKKEADDNGNS